MDELHSAWCIAGTLGQVGERAAIGNQQPAYFIALYLWRHLVPASLVAVYGIEATLRATSVLMTSLSAAWLVAIVSGTGIRSRAWRPPSRNPSSDAARGGRFSPTRNTLVGGIAAGLAFALQRDAIFFGTELRPYAAIMLITTAALALARHLTLTGYSIEAETPGNTLPIGSDAASRNPASPEFVQPRGCWGRAALHGLVMFAAAVHVTSLIVLAPQLMVFAIYDLWRHRAHAPSRRAIGITHVAAGVIWIVGAVLWIWSHGELWQSRDNWNSFAITQGWGDLWRMWPWGALVIVPVVGWAVAARLGASISWLRRGAFQEPRDDSGRRRDLLMAGLVLAGVIGSTVVCYLLSAYAGVPLWHRRYLVASLPLLCAVMGWFIGATRCFSQSATLVVQIAMASACLALLLTAQGALATWGRGVSQLARRGEDWRSAVAWVRDAADDDDQVWIDAGLIEQNTQPTLVADPKVEEYLRYVTAGPYRLGERVHCVAAGRDAIAAWLAPSAPDDSGHSSTDLIASQSRFLITRRQSHRFNRLPVGIKGYRFGRVTVLTRR
ncbi:hypothetical protein [Allorhodopirellula solitaria]|uniref:hypothetical protein n=1 Tax=Allorhodopirellula solitaria TaxID=2527987 RepID=UPI0011B43B87|nr:hypothetical protein [Allorhodopirellula solitaria]